MNITPKTVATKLQSIFSFSICIYFVDLSLLNETRHIIIAIKLDFYLKKKPGFSKKLIIRNDRFGHQS